MFQELLEPSGNFLRDTEVRKESSMIITVSSSSGTVPEWSSLSVYQFLNLQNPWFICADTSTYTY